MLPSGSYQPDYDPVQLIFSYIVVRAEHLSSKHLN
jgi:hypothetical protein